ncbi:MAG: response regulator [Patescibacteria group bacterium]
MSENPIKILIVEDDTFLLNMYADKFRAEKFDVSVADNGIKALKLAQENKPEIILLDILLPKKNGFEVLEELKANKETSNIAVILLTNLSQKEEVKKRNGFRGKRFFNQSPLYA